MKLTTDQAIEILYQIGNGYPAINTLKFLGVKTKFNFNFEKGYDKEQIKQTADFLRSLADSLEGK